MVGISWEAQRLSNEMSSATCGFTLDSPNENQVFNEANQQS